MPQTKAPVAKDGALLVKDSKTITVLERQLYSLLANDRLVRKFLAEAFFAIKSNDKLMRSTMHSLLCSIFEAASVGLSLANASGQAYLVPFKNNKKAGQPLEAKLIIGYRGYETLAWRECKIKIFSECVFKKDVFGYTLGSHPAIVHEPYIPSLEQPENRMISDEFKGAYAIFTYPDAYQFPLFHDRQEIEKRRNRSKASDDGPWVSDFYAMAKKCPIREGASKYVAHDFAPRLVEMATRDDLRSLNMQVGPAILDSGKTTEEAASEITGDPPDNTAQQPVGTGDDGTGVEAEAENSGSNGSGGDTGQPIADGFKYVEGRVLSAVSRGKIKWITLKTDKGEFQLSTFDSEHLRRAQELVNSGARITYTDATKGDKVYHNVARGASIEAI